MNLLYLLTPISIIWLILGFILFAFIFNGLPETKRQKIIFVCFIGPVGIIVWTIGWIISKLKEYYYE